MSKTKLYLISAIITAFLQSPARPQPQPITAWVNGYWFNGTSFVRMDMYSVGPRLALIRPSKVDRTVDLAGEYTKVVTPSSFRINE
jgi:hypothetical protein